MSQNPTATTVWDAVNRIRLNVMGFVGWSLPLKLAIGGLGVALGSAGLLGFLSEYATYFYAIYYGFRPPVEGVPYLRATVTLWSLFLPLTAAIVFLMVYVFFKTYRMPLELGERVAAKFGIDLDLTATKHTPNPGWYGVFGLSLVLPLLTIIGTKFPGVGLELPAKTLTEFNLLLFGEFVLGVFAFLAIIKPHLVGAAGGVVACVYLMGWCAVLFTPDYYSTFLRFVGFGGGLPITVEHEAVGKGRAVTTGFLLIRSADAFIIYDGVHKEVAEIPKAEVHRVIHKAGGLTRLPYEMPR